MELGVNEDETLWVSHMEHGSDGRCLGVGVWLQCPGCKSRHRFTVRCDEHGGPDERDGVTWEWDGDRRAPTFSPSMLVRWSGKSGETVCHSFLRGGKWEFLTDSTHSAAGQSGVSLATLPDWIKRAARDDQDSEDEA